MPCSAHLWSTWRTDSMCEGKSSLKIMMSSTTFCMFLIPVRASSPRRLCSSPADLSPMTLRLNRKAPHGVRNVVSFELSSSSGIGQYPCLESRVVKYFDPSVIAATASRPGCASGICWSFDVLVEPGEINGPTRFDRVLLGNNNHWMAPCEWFTYWYLLNDALWRHVFKLLLNGFPPTKGDLTRPIMAAWNCVVLKVDVHWWSMHGVERFIRKNLSKLFQKCTLHIIHISRSLLCCGRFRSCARVMFSCALVTDWQVRKVLYPWLRPAILQEAELDTRLLTEKWRL